MRTLTSIVLALSILSFFACSGNTIITDTITQTQTETQQGQETTTTITTTEPAQTVIDTITSTIRVTSTENVTTTTTLTTTPEVESVQLISETDCGDNQICYHITVEYADLAAREAEIRAYHYPDSKGTVVFLGGGWGKGWYADASEHHIEIVHGIRDEGYETYEIRWLGEFGWGTDNFGQGPKKLTIAIADVVRWIVTNIANNSDVVGAVGSSGGSNILAYGLTVHGLDDILDIVLLAPGPVWTDLVTLCDIGMPGAKSIVDYCMGWQEDGYYCTTGNCPEWVVQALQEQSVVSSVPGENRDFHYPATKVVFIEGELDEPSMVNALLFYDTITSERSLTVLEDVGHGIPGNPLGASLIQSFLLEGLGNIAN